MKKSAILIAALISAAPIWATPPEGIATEATKAANAEVAAELPIADQSDFENANRGLLAKIPGDKILNEDGSVAWDSHQFDFITGAAPDTVNPSLWRQAKLNSVHGLFEVVPGIYQIRGYDLAQMTLIAGKTGWIIVDPLTTPAPAKAGLALANKTLGDRPVVAVIFTHSHGDHFGGIAGVASPEDVRSGKIQIIAPHGFLAESVGESVIAGTAMNRRVQYQFGTALPVGTTGHVGGGLGQKLSSGDVSLVPPTRSISKAGETLTIDGISFDFMDAGETEAPAELVFYMPQFKALHTAEVATRTFHNVLTPRGALVRDARNWAAQLLAARRSFASRSEVMFTSHFWPRWGTQEIDDYLLTHAQAYAFVHNESIRLLNAGLDGAEIAEAITLPPPLARAWYNRGHYGDLKFNARAVYQRYLGAFNGDPATLDPLPRDVLARKWVAALGGAERARALAADAAFKGDDRWASTLYSQLVRAGDEASKPGLAASFEQLAMRAESAVWRNFYLSGAAELRAGIAPVDDRGNNRLGANLRMTDLLDAISVRILPDKAITKTTIAFIIPDTNERHLVTLANGVMLHEPSDAPADASLTAPRLAFIALLSGQRRAPELIANGALGISGDPGALQRLVAALAPPAARFPIVTPVSAAVSGLDSPPPSR